MLNKILSIYTKYFAVWIIACGIIAYFFPKPFIAVSSLNKWFFALTMFGIGMVLCVNDIEVGMQNAGLGVVLAKNNFGDRAAMPAAFFIFICIITASLAAEYWRRDKTLIQRRELTIVKAGDTI